MNIKNSINYFRQKLTPDCQLIAVSKTQPPEKIVEAYDAGQRAFGENKVQELVPKHESLPKDIEWHMIGHLQSNKVKYIAPFVHLIHSIDSVSLLQEVNRQGGKNNRVIPCLLQVFIADEKTKYGFSEDEVMELITSSAFPDLKNIAVKGLMGMATFTDNMGKVRAEFRKLKEFFDRLRKNELPPNVQMEELSMGMSADFEIAMEEGSTLVRIGTAIFGDRNINTNHLS
jgi:pyridoxal phosphate enzyme (YggS family)